MQPISIWNVACFVGRGVFLLAPPNPPAYFACAALCNAAVTGVGLIDYVTCDQALEAAKENAKASYCACLDHKLANCPDWAEVDLVGCP